MKWFRLYSSVLNDPKVQRLPPALFKHWINILCVASENDPRGDLPSVKDLAFALRLKTPRCQKIVDSLCAAGVLDADTAGTLRVHSWDRRQRDSDNVAARVDAHRKRKHQGSEQSPIGNVTLQETLQKRTVDRDTDRDIEENKRETYAPLTMVPRRGKQTQEGEPLTRTRTASHSNPHWDALVEAFGYEPKTTAERSKWGKAVADLKKSGATAEDVLHAKANYDHDVDSGVIAWTLSPLALVAHLGELLQAPRQPVNSRPRQNGHLVAVADIPATIPRLVGE